MSLGHIDDKSTWVQVMARVPSGNKPLPEPKLTQIYDAIMSSQGINGLTAWSNFHEAWGKCVMCDISIVCWKCIWVRSQNWGCLVTWFYYQLIAKPGDKTASVPWPDSYMHVHDECQCRFNKHMTFIWQGTNVPVEPPWWHAPWVYEQMIKQYIVNL